MAAQFEVHERPIDDLVELRFTVNGTAPGLAFLPADADEPMPLVIIQHPATASKDDYFVRDVAMMWARRGWICGGLDAPYHGERPDYDPMRVLRDRDGFPALSATFSAEISATIDALAADYPVDVSRLGFVGYSMGSMLGIPAVAADGRFKAAAFTLIGAGGVLGEADAPGSPFLELGSVAVRVVAKMRDEFFPKESTEALYNALPGKKDLLYLPGGHFEIGPDVIDAAGKWLAAEL